ncbi:hypothetical protein ABW19_dt0209913 [Dactylella cylindrospora]|nr:hypothetical protein ABW19_dt0209913 [Dactylella cylindrospora]
MEAPRHLSPANLTPQNQLDLVEAFNSLPRSRCLPSGVPSNTWHFSIRHIPLDPPGDVLFIVNTASRFLHTEGPIQYPSSPDPNKSDLETRAKAIVPFLLRTFSNRFNINDQQVPAFAPWTWITCDGEFAELVEKELRAAGVREDLCAVGLGSRRENEEAQEDWCKFVGALTRVTTGDYTIRNP